jgi:P-loop containing NTP hydrolase pore-1
LIFDEGHKAKNFFAENERGSGTQTGAAVVEIQDVEKFPRFRVIYSSATAATDVKHLGYMIRLGLWGQGTPFAEFAEFAREIEEGGVGAMEMTARDLKAMGRYFCGSLSMGIDEESGLGVKYREVVHHLTTHQRERSPRRAIVFIPTNAPSIKNGANTSLWNLNAQPTSSYRTSGVRTGAIRHHHRFIYSLWV